ncbi:MAG: hypothetical protein LC796_14765 [Acidobacteria bacterium]|nr:hypothetical protein [Acidobacteriota bacterium]MCA1609539.1 hypothetical protein [Acidobacteriota bacterium]
MRGKDDLQRPRDAIENSFTSTTMQPSGGASGRWRVWQSNRKPEKVT